MDEKRNPAQPAGPQVGQTVNGKMEFPPDFGVEAPPMGTLEDLERENPDLLRSDRKQEKRNLDNRTDDSAIHGLDTPEGLG